MSFSSYFFLGKTFDPERYEELEKEVQYHTKLDNELNGINEEGPSRWQRTFNLRFRVRDKMKKMAGKTKSVFSRLGSLCKSRAQHETELNRGLDEEHVPLKESPRSVTIQETQVHAPEKIGENASVEMEQIVSSEDTEEQKPEYDDAPRRNKHKARKEEKMTFIEKGFVERLAQRLEPQLLDKLSTELTPENSSPPFTPEALTKRNQSSMETIDSMGKVECILPPSLHLKAADLPETVYEPIQLDGLVAFTRASLNEEVSRLIAKLPRLARHE